MRPHPVASAPDPSAPTGTGPPIAGSLDATALLGLLLSNPQIMQSVRGAPIASQGVAPPSVQVNVPGSGPTAIPLGDIMNVFAMLMQRSVEELSDLEAESDLTSEDDPAVPEYLFGEDGELLVDPANAQDRAAYTLELLRKHVAEAQCWRDGGLAADWDTPNPFDRSGAFARGTDESDLWAYEAGFNG